MKIQQIVVAVIFLLIFVLAKTPMISALFFIAAGMIIAFGEK